MAYDNFIKEYLEKGLLKEQKCSIAGVEKIIRRSEKDLKTAKANLTIDEGIAYTVAYLAMLRASRAYILLKGFRPSDGYQHKTTVDFIDQFLGKDYRDIIDYFDRMRRKRNIFTYEIDVSISKIEATNAFNTAEKFVTLIKDVIRKENPQQSFNF